jgi:hypothetical protein
MSKIDIRKASADDSRFLAMSMLKSTRSGQKTGVFDLIFDEQNDELLLKKLEQLITSQTKVYCHYSNFLIASIDGKDVGTLCNYEPRISTTAILEESLLQIGISLRYVQSAEEIPPCMLQADKRVWMLDFFVIQENHGGVEAIKALLKKSLLTASLKGYRVARIIIKAGSADTILIFKKLGFNLVLEERCELLRDNFEYSGVSVMEMHL